MRWSSPAALVLCLWSLAIISVILGVAAGLVTLSAAADAGSVGVMAVLTAVVCLTAGCCVGAVLWATAWVCRREHQQRLLQERVALALERLAGSPAAASGAQVATSQAEALRRAASASAAQGRPEGAEAEPPSAARPAGTGPPVQVPVGTAAEALLEEIRELNVNVLLSDSQRQVKRRYLTGRGAERLKADVERAVASGDLGQADESLDRLLRVAPDVPGIEELSERLEQARSQAESRDVAEARRRVEDLVSVSGFAAATAVVNGLLAKHPSCAEAIALLERVRREREAFVNEQRLAMYRKVEKQAASRHWSEALSAADELLAAYPNSPEADAVRTRLDTLRENARIEEARDLRDKVSELISRRRFGEAVELARDLIARFPATAAAGELRQQMPKLEELARPEQDAGQ